MSSDTSTLHKSKKSAAVLKHAIIDSYATSFASKTGSTSTDNHVAFIDGPVAPPACALVANARIFREAGKLLRPTP